MLRSDEVFSILFVLILLVKKILRLLFDSSVLNRNNDGIDQRQNYVRMSKTRNNFTSPHK
jgi:hypothetical protein